jgi:hypothetical protein
MSILIAFLFAMISLAEAASKDEEFIRDEICQV